MTADIRYADSDGAHIAYQVIGDGPRDLIVVMDGFIPVDTMEGEPRLARAMARLASFSRLIRFDRRGIGLSDPVAASSPPTLEQWVGDTIAVLDAAGSQRVSVLASAEASLVGILIAAMHPERVEALVVVNGMARTAAADDYPMGLSPEQMDQWFAITETAKPAGNTDYIVDVAPSAAHDEEFRRWWIETGRRGASPATADALLRMQLLSDVRSALPAVQAPVLAVALRGDLGFEAGRYVADHVANSKFVAIDGRDNYWWSADSAGAVLDEIEEFLTGARASAVGDRVLATLLFTDIVASTERAAAMGDARWRELLDSHDATVRRQLTRFGGTEVKTMGDGFLARFSGPARAVECACAIRDAARQLGVQIRAGLHTGEVELLDDDVRGIAVAIAARVAALAEPECVWVSRTVADLVVGSGITFTAQGEHTLKGVPGQWQLLAVD
jgi:class 3 adenylate cyclase